MRLIWDADILTIPAVLDGIERGRADADVAIVGHDAHTTPTTGHDLLTRTSSVPRPWKF